MQEKETTDVAIELASLTRFLKRNFVTLVLSAAAGLLFGIWIALSRGTPDPFSLFHSFELRFELAQGVSEQASESPLPGAEPLELDREMTLFLKSRFEAYAKEQTTPSKDIRTVSIFTENTPIVIVQVSTTSNFDLENLRHVMTVALEKSLRDLEAKRTSDKTKAKIFLFEVQDRILTAMQKQEAILGSLAARRSKAAIRMTDNYMPSWTTRGNDGDSLHDLRRLALALNQVDLSSEERERIQTEFNELDLEIQSLANNRKHLTKSERFQRIFGEEGHAYRIASTNLRNTTSKEISKQVVIVLSGLFAGIVFGFLLCLTRVRLLGIAERMKALKQQEG